MIAQKSAIFSHQCRTPTTLLSVHKCFRGVALLPTKMNIDHKKIFSFVSVSIVNVHKAWSWNEGQPRRMLHLRHPLAFEPNAEPHQSNCQYAKHPSVEFRRLFSLAIAFLPAKQIED